MIWESQYWKDPLLKSAEYLRRVRLAENTSERTFVRIEKEIFLGFYAVRKLLDTFKVSDSTKEMKIDLVVHPAIRRVDYLNWHQLDKNYDLNLRKSETKDIRFLCNQFVHSYVFMTSEIEGRLNGFFVTSDRDRHSKCYFVDVEHVLKIFRTVGRDYPSTSEFRRDDNGQWIGQVGRT
jgi:hypothetical protein